jgi:hypothetical protein
MKKTAYFMFILLFISTSLSAQMRINTTIGYLGDFGDFNNVTAKSGFAIDANVRFNSQKKFQWGVGTGFYQTSRKISLYLTDGTNSNFIPVSLVTNYVPITIGFDKYFSQKRLRPFISPEGGILLTNYRLVKNQDTPSGTTITNTDNTKVNFTLGTSFGVLYDLNEQMSFITKARYTGIIDQNGYLNNALGFSVGLSFVVGKN